MKNNTVYIVITIGNENGQAAVQAAYAAKQTAEKHAERLCKSTIYKLAYVTETEVREGTW